MARTPDTRTRTTPRRTRDASARGLRFTHGLTQATMARLLGVSLRTVTKMEKEGAAATPRSLVEVRRLLDALGSIMQPAHVGAWLHEANDAFGGAKPLEVVERGEVDRLFALVHHVGSGEPV